MHGHDHKHLLMLGHWSTPSVIFSFAFLFVDGNIMMYSRVRKIGGNKGICAICHFPRREDELMTELLNHRTIKFILKVVWPN
jgi:hypothetical protein